MGRNGSNEWKTAQLGDVIELFDSQRVPLNSRERQQRKGEYPYYGAQGVIDHIDGYIFDGRYILVAEDGENLNSKKLPLALFATGKFWVNNHAHILRGKPGIADDTFLLACLNNADIKPFVTGAAQPKLSQANMRQIQIPLPPLPVQRRIAGILSAYDELMENSQRRIRLLEAMARALYREWFVHFRFPGHEKLPRVASPLGDIPQGWEVTTLGNVVSMITKGTTPTTLGRQYQTEGLNFIKAESIEESGALLESKFAKIDLETHELLRRSQLCANDILFSIAGVIGRVSIVPNRVLPANTNQALAIIRCSTPFHVPYLYMTLRDEQFQNYSFGRIVQTAQANVSLTDLRTAPLVLPPSELLSKLNAFAEPLMAQIQALSEQIQNLRRTRDLLLPRLLSGQVELKTEGA